MLDFHSCVSAFSDFDSEHSSALHRLPSPPVAKSLYPPHSSLTSYSPSAFTFDPFADEDDLLTSSSSDGHSHSHSHSPPPPTPPNSQHYDPLAYPRSWSNPAIGETQRHQKVEFLKQREWMRRVIAWVDNVNSGMVRVPSALFPPLPHVCIDAFCRLSHHSASLFCTAYTLCS